MKRILLALIALTIAHSGMAQITSTVTSQGTTCWNSNDGSYTLQDIRGCFAPLTVNVDSTNYAFDHLTNNGYTMLNHGQGSGTDRAYSVWAGQTSSGPVYLATGTFNDSITFDSVTVYATGLQDMFVVCFDATNGDVLWAHNGGTAGDYTAGYAITGAGDKAYVTGYLVGNSQIAGYSITSSGGYQGYIAKIDIPTGTTDTVAQYGNAGADEGFNIHYAAGRLYLSGDYSSSITLAGNTFTSAGNQDAFLVCVDTSLATDYWSMSGGGAGFDVMPDVVAYVNGAGVAERVYVVGQYTGSATYGSFNLTSTGSDDFFVAAIDTTGTVMWVTDGGSTGGDYTTTIDLDSDGDRIYVGGSWIGTMTFDGQVYTAGVNRDGFIAYMDTAGSLDTCYVLSGTGPDYVLDLQSVSDDYLVFSGRFAGTLTYADSAFVSNGNHDAFLGKIGPGHHEIWGKNFGGTGNDVYNSVRIGPDERVHTCGFFTNDASAYQAGLVSAGGDDVVVSNGSLSGLVDSVFVVTGLSGGNYVYSITDSLGNSIIDTVVITSPDTMVISAAVVHATTATNNDGSVDLSVTGGTPGYTFLWSTGSTAEDLDSVMTGTYCVTVTDSLGCVDSACFYVDSVFNAGPLIVDATTTDLACFGDSNGSIDLTVSGGVLPYSFAWSNGATSEDLFGLAAGSYTVTVSDNDTSVYIDSFLVTQPSEIVISGVITPPSSGSATDGAIDVTTTGGLPPYSFVWSTGATTEDVTDLAIGTYSVTVSDSAGCSAVRSFVVDTIPGLSLSSQSSDVTCLNTDNGTIDLTVLGGVPPFSFSWSNGATTEDISGLAAGAYSVTVTDSVAQTATLTDSVGSDPIHPDPIVGPINGSASVQAWTTYNYDVPLTSGSAFDWSIAGGEVSSAASNAASILWYGGPTGTVYVTETDANGCMAQDSLEVTILFVGVDEHHSHAIAVYPNPATETLHIGLPTGISKANIQLYDLQGRVVMTEKLFSGTRALDVSHLPSGSFVLRVEAIGTVLHHTIIIQ